MSESLWKEVRTILCRRLNSDEFNLWMTPLVVAGGELRADRSLSDLRLQAETVYAAKWVKEHYARHINFAVDAVCAERGWHRPRVRYEILPSGLDVKRVRGDFRRATRGVRINPGLSFRSFIEGDSNRMAKLICLEVATLRNAGENNLYVLCGNCGLGKTHLMHAIVNEVNRNGDDASLFVNAESFVMDLRDHIVRNDMNEFKRRYRAELEDKPQLTTLLKLKAGEGPVTLLFSARDLNRNQAVALKDYLEAENGE